MVEAGRCPPQDVQVEGREQPWKIKNPWACCMTKEEYSSIDPAFFQFSREFSLLLLLLLLLLVLLYLLVVAAVMLLAPELPLFLFHPPNQPPTTTP